MRIHGAKKGLRARQQTPVGVGSAKKEREWSCLSSQPPPPAYSNSIFRPLAIGGVQQLDSPASRDQINDRDDQGDHQQEMDQAAGHVESPA